MREEFATSTSLISLICLSSPPTMSYVESGTFSTIIRLTRGSTWEGTHKSTDIATYSCLDCTCHCTCASTCTSLRVQIIMECIQARTNICYFLEGNTDGLLAKLIFVSIQNISPWQNFLLHITHHKNDHEYDGCLICCSKNLQTPQE